MSSHEIKEGSGQNGYQLKDIKSSDTHFTASLNLLPDHHDPIPEYGTELKNLKIKVEYQTANRIRVRISDLKEERWRVPKDVVKLNENTTIKKGMKTNFDYEFGYESNPFGFYIKRKGDNERIFDITNQRFIFKNQYIEISTKLPSQSNIYGFGETVGSFKRSVGSRMTIWARDAQCHEGENLYGSHPYYVELRNGKAHGVFLLNSNGMDVIYEEEKLTYKVIGGILDFYIFTGPSPIDVVQQYTELIGNPYFIPYWSLGYHQCRWGYDTIPKVEDTVKRHKEANIPMDAVWIDIDYMDLYKPFTFSPSHFPPDQFAKFAESLHQNNQRLVAIVDPGIKVLKGFEPYDEGREKNLFIKRADGEDFVGKVWPGTTVFPDWFHPESQEYWKENILKWINQVPIDGIWIDMNEIANFVNGDLSHETNIGCRDDKIMIPSDFQTVTDMVVDESDIAEDLDNKIDSDEIINLDVNNPPYSINNGGTESPLFTRTSPMDAFHHTGIKEYDAHNLFGHMEAIATFRALSSIRPNQRPFILSRSTFPSSGKYAAHWLGDNSSEWDDLIYSISGILSFQLFGIPMVGADICGFNGKCKEDIAIRWFQLGSFYPFCRNHNAINMPGQECYMTKKVERISKIWIHARYQLLPYWYTIFYFSSTKGLPVTMPLWFLDPNVQDTWDIDRQYLIGESILVTPVLESESTKVTGYIPAGRWYDFISGKIFYEGDQGKLIELDAPIEIIPIHIRGGSIIPMHCQVGLQIYECRKSGIKLQIALDPEGKAKGNLYLDDGETLFEKVGNNYTLVSFTVENKKLKVEGTFGYRDGQGAFVDEIVFLGSKELNLNEKTKFIVSSSSSSSSSPSLVTDGIEVQLEKVIAENVVVETDNLVIKGLGIELTGEFTVSWE
ncbi:hypothetical protein Glove_48g60 [Diversispora epigaea]|uniref:Maltase n=1 Tax=Diversispora epigaea TaxID=1348612 RepID=A0A397JHI0_9GLOM|nr:hypothetical protein Glove_48g60 [Diversispora epigaea]